MVTRSGDNLQLPPAMLASLAGFLQQTHAYTTQSQDSPSRGAVIGHTNTSSQAQSQARIPKREKNYNSIQADTTFDHPQQRPNLTHLPAGI